MKRQFKAAIVGAALVLPALLGVRTAAAQVQPTLEHIVKTGALRLCFEAGYIPFEMKTKNGRFIGFDIDIAKQMARSIGVKFVPVNTAWDGIVPALQTNKCDYIVGMGITPKRNLQVNFADPYLVIGQSLLISPKLAGKVKSYRDLNHSQYTIASQLGTSGAMAAERHMPKANLQLFETSADAVLQVANGKADAFVYDLPYNAIYASQHRKQVVHLDQPFTYEPLGWAIRQNDPNFLNFLNHYLRQIKGDGTYQRIYDKWFKSDRWLQQIQ
jgi:polar amino acid transport system substrate-binding protein